MAAGDPITDLSDLLTLMTDGSSAQILHCFKDNRVGAAAAVAGIAGRFTDLFTFNGAPAGGITPTTTGSAPDNTVDGSMFQVSPSGGKKQWLVGVAAQFNAAGTLLIYDRLQQDGGLNGTTTTLQVTTGTPTRYTSTAAAGNLMFVGISTQIGATSTTIQLEYTDQGGTTTVLSPATAIGNTGLREAQRLIPIPYAAGDTGARIITGADLLATTGTAGDFYVMLARPLCTVPLPGIAQVGAANFVSFPPGLIEIKAGACISSIFISQSTTVPSGTYTIALVDK